MKNAIVALLVVGFAFGASAETWTWIGGSTWGWGAPASGGGKRVMDLGSVENAKNLRDWTDGYNWQDSQGIRGDHPGEGTHLPQHGDVIVFDTDGQNEYTHCFGGGSGVDYGGILFKGSKAWGGYFGSQPVVKNGFVSNTIPAAVGLARVWCVGTVEVAAIAGSTLSFSFAKATGQTVGNCVKTGAGTYQIVHNEDKTQFGTLEIREGTVKMGETNLLSQGTTALRFTGSNTVLDLNGKWQDLNCPIETTVEATDAIITSQTPAVLRLKGNQVDTTFSGRLNGAVSICWNPNDGTKTLTLPGTVDTTGTLIVSNGTIDVSAATVSSLTRFEVGDGGRLALPSGIYNDRLLVGGVQVAAGVYTGTGPRGTKVDWLDGNGLVIVGVDVGTEVLWTSAGSLGVAANWNGSTQTPDLFGGSTILKTTTAVAGATADVDDAFLNGLALGGGADFTLSGSKGLLLGAGGVALTGNACNFTVETPLGIVSPQLWDLSNGSGLHVKAPLAAYSPDAVLTITNGAVSFYGGTQDVAITYSEVFSFQGSTTNIFNKKVRMAQRAAMALSSGGTASNLTIFNGGLELCNASSTASDGTMNGQGTMVFTNGTFVVHSSKRVNFTSGEYHFYSPNNSFNDGQRGYIHGTAVLYFHVTNAFTSTQANLAGNHGDGGVIDLCGCDQTVGTIQCGRGLNNASGKSTGWKWAVHPGTIRSEKPALLRISSGSHSENPGTSSSPTTTNFAYFVGMAGISYEGGSNGHWLNQSCSSTGTVQTTKGCLHFSKRVIDADGCDLGEGSWPNAAKAIAKGSGTLVFEHSNAIGKKTDVIIDGNGKVQLDAGVNQRCADLYFGTEKQELGTWGSPESAATHKDARFTGTGILTVRGQNPGLILLVR